MITQSKPTNSDVEKAIGDSGLKRTYTPCVLLQKDAKDYNLRKIAELPQDEHIKVLFLLLPWLKVAYLQRYANEKNSS